MTGKYRGTVSLQIYSLRPRARRGKVLAGKKPGYRLVFDASLARSKSMRDKLLGASRP